MSEGFILDTDGNIVEFKVTVIEAAPGENEHLWARYAGPMLGRIDNIPFRVCGLSWGDTVKVERDGDRVIVSERVATSGHATLRLLKRAGSETEVTALLAWLETAGCAYEVISNYPLVAIDIPPTASLPAILARLEAGKAENLWSYEEGSLPGFTFRQTGLRRFDSPAYS